MSMRPLNHKERTNLFWQFLMLFTCTVGIFLFAIYWDFELPVTLHTIETKQFEQNKNFIRNQNKLLDKMGEIDTLIAGIPTASNPVMQNQTAAAAIVQLKNVFGSDTAQNYLLNRISNVYSSYLSDKVGLNNCLKDKSQLLSKIQEKDQMIMQLNQQITQLRASSAGFP